MSSQAGPSSGPSKPEGIGAEGPDENTTRGLRRLPRPRSTEASGQIVLARFGPLHPRAAPKGQTGHRPQRCGKRSGRLKPLSRFTLPTPGPPGRVSRIRCFQPKTQEGRQKNSEHTGLGCCNSCDWVAVCLKTSPCAFPVPNHGTLGRTVRPM